MMLTSHLTETKQILMNERIAVDTNVVLYALNDAEPVKKAVALNITGGYPVLSVQSFTEVINVCRRKWKYSKDKQIGIAEFLLNNYQLVPTNQEVV